MLIFRLFLQGLHIFFFFFFYSPDYGVFCPGYSLLIRVRNDPWSIEFYLRSDQVPRSTKGLVPLSCNHRSCEEGSCSSCACSSSATSPPRPPACFPGLSALPSPSGEFLVMLVSVVVARVMPQGGLCRWHLTSFSPLLAFQWNWAVKASASWKPWCPLCGTHQDYPGRRGLLPNTHCRRSETGVAELARLDQRVLVFPQYSIHAILRERGLPWRLMAVASAEP